MQTKSRKSFKKARTAKGHARQSNAYDIAKLKSQGLYDPSKKSRLCVRRISEMTPQEKAEFGVSP
jgi:hypothetical protein